MLFSTYIQEQKTFKTVQIIVELSLNHIMKFQEWLDVG